MKGGGRERKREIDGGMEGERGYDKDRQGERTHINIFFNIIRPKGKKGEEETRTN